jgi:nicotinamidase-related amidase
LSTTISVVAPISRQRQLGRNVPRRLPAPVGRRRGPGALGSSGFANTDLDLQLKQHGVRRIVLTGMIANTCLESTGRFGMELGYHVTLVKDATAAFSREAMHAAHAINGPTYAHAIVTTEELIPQLAA